MIDCHTQCSAGSSSASCRQRNSVGLPHRQHWSLRQKLRAAFPGAPIRQTQIVHVSVLRLLTAQQLRLALQSVSNKFTEQLKGVHVTATELW